ncbi:ERI1 exoribonuclease 2-like isoform X2 [Lucilia cuprina]|uniref:ERI1 exoribonuclease 2-like isoform X2 n=1 Tax=Lucilia cuprina TaxID=7375 RepID=UPI001F065493|nr:ERI1 exoribonuclease 2-like isoform X2 [Lucilia cuprina]
MDKKVRQESTTLIFKNIPKQMEDLTGLLDKLKLPAREVKPFGRKRALIIFQEKNEAEKALSALKELEFNGNCCNIAIFCKDKPNNNSIEQKPKNSLRKSNKSIQTQLEDTNGTQQALNKQQEQLNKQLGLIDTIYVDGGQPQNNNTSTKSSKSKLSLQSYEYVIAVDFEATCWENKAPPKWRESEIIEFPAVLVNLKTGKIEAEFHKYIMPIESPKLSAFCTELTGITQKTVDNGIPLQTALMMFQEWLRKELRARHLMLPKVSKDNKIGNCAFVTWTDWDFGICLDKECSRKRIKKPPYFNQWIDMRVIYREWYKYKPLNFLDALTYVGLQFEGKQHSGIDDAKNLAALTHKLVNDGATLAITKDLTPFQLNLNCVF